MNITASLRSILVLLLLTAGPFAVLEVWVRTSLFRYASYTNSVTFDRTWRALEDDSSWNLVMLGNSEVRWGFSTDALDAALGSDGLYSQSLNLAVDGLRFDQTAYILPRLELKRRMPELRVAVIGVQLTDPHVQIAALLKHGLDCGSALTRPVFTSPWGRDTGVSGMCRDAQKANLILQALERVSAIVRYRVQIHAALMEWLGVAPTSLSDSSGLPMSSDGYHPHVPIILSMANYEDAIGRLRREKESNPGAFTRLPPHLWPELVQRGGLFDYWAQQFEAMDVLPVFVALPTNPDRIDIATRQEDYARDSRLMEDWAARTGRLYFDLGRPDYTDKEILYSDHRHLSFVGASRFTTRLAQAMAREPRIRLALSVREGDALTGAPMVRLPANVFGAGSSAAFRSYAEGVARPLRARRGSAAAVLLTSTAVSLAPVGDGNTTTLSLPPTYASLTAGRTVTLTITARSAPRRGSAEMMVMYSRPGVGADGWKAVALNSQWTRHDVVFTVPTQVAGATFNDLIAIWADKSGNGLGAEVSQISLDILH